MSHFGDAPTPRDLEEARSEATSPERLVELVKLEMEGASDEALRNPSFPTEVLYNYLRRGDIAAWESPNMPFVLVQSPDCILGSLICATQQRVFSNDLRQALWLPAKQAWKRIHVAQMASTICSLMAVHREDKATEHAMHTKLMAATLTIVREVVPLIGIHPTISPVMEMLQRWMHTGENPHLMTVSRWTQELNHSSVRTYDNSPSDLALSSMSGLLAMWSDPWRAANTIEHAAWALANSPVPLAKPMVEAVSPHILARFRDLFEAEVPWSQMTAWIWGMADEEP